MMFDIFYDSKNHWHNNINWFLFLNLHVRLKNLPNRESRLSVYWFLLVMPTVHPSETSCTCTSPSQMRAPCLLSESICTLYTSHWSQSTGDGGWWFWLVALAVSPTQRGQRLADVAVPWAADWSMRLRLGCFDDRQKWCWCCDNGSHPDKQHLDRVCLNNTAAAHTQVNGTGVKQLNTERKLPAAVLKRVSSPLEKKKKDWHAWGRPVLCFCVGGWETALKYVGLCKNCKSKLDRWGKVWILRCFSFAGKSAADIPWVQRL